LYVYWPNLTTRDVLDVPRPGVAIERASGIDKLAVVDELPVGVGLFVRGISQDRNSRSVAHFLHLVIRVADHIEAALHPLAFLVLRHLAARSHGPRLHVSS